MRSVRKDEFFHYFRWRLENLKHLGTLRTSFEPEQNILAGAELDALAKYWATNERRASPSPTRMGEFLATHGDARIWNKCCHTDLRERAILRNKKKPSLLTSDDQTRTLEAVIVRLLPKDAAINARILTWKDDPDFPTLKSDATLQNACIPENFLADSRYGALLYRYYRCAWVHELNSDPRLATDETLPREIFEEPYYMERIE